jgi:hypothetical protein
MKGSKTIGLEKLGQRSKPVCDLNLWRPGDVQAEGRSRLPSGVSVHRKTGKRDGEHPRTHLNLGIVASRFEAEMSRVVLGACVSKV